MAEKQKSNVGVVLVNNLGSYNKRYFYPLQRIMGHAEDLSFLIANLRYFSNTNDTLEPPKQLFDNDWRPPEYGKPLFLIKEGEIPENLAKMYLDIYSLDGKFGKLVDLGYLCVPDIDKICQYLTSGSPFMQKRAIMMMQRDKTVIDLAYTALEVQSDIKDKTLREKTTRSIFYALIDGLRDAPISYKFELPKVLTDRQERLKLAGGDEQKYALITQESAKEVFKEGRRQASIANSQSR